MLTPDYLAHVADDIVALYESYEDTLIADMARRIAKLGVTDTSVWQMEAYQEAGGVYHDAIRDIAAMTSKTESELRAAFENAGARSLAYDDNVYRAVGLNPLPPKQSPAMLQVLVAGMRKTGASMKNLTMTTAVTSQQSFIRAADLAYMQVVGGGMSYTEAIKRAVKGIADEGTYVLYPTGHRDLIDVAMRRTVLTGVNQTCAELQLMRADEMGCEYVETTAHMGARPSHSTWQGQVFHRNGAKDGYEDFEESTGYGSGAGLCGWNCRHGFHPFYPEYTKPSYTQDDVRAMQNETIHLNDRDIPVYEVTQRQRAMERGIRKTKRELVALDSAGSATGDSALKTSLRSEFDQTAVKLKRQEAKLHDFLGKTGLPPQNERTQVLGFSRSQAQKAVWAGKKKRI